MSKIIDHKSIPSNKPDLVVRTSNIMPDRPLLTYMQTLSWIECRQVKFLEIDPLLNLLRDAGLDHLTLDLFPVEDKYIAAHTFLHNALIERKLVCIAGSPSYSIRSGTWVNGISQTVPFEFFATPDLSFAPTGEVFLKENRIDHRLILANCRFIANEVRKVWPPNEEAEMVPVPQPKLKKWYERWVAEYVADGKRASKNETMEAATTQFPNHKPPSVRVINALRRDLPTPKEWLRPGRWAETKRDGK